MSGPIYALNLFDVSNKDEYMAYSRQSARRFRRTADASSRLANSEQLQPETSRLQRS